jgi:hypothetical protein
MHTDLLQCDVVIPQRATPRVTSPSFAVVDFSPHDLHDAGLKT